MVECEFFNRPFTLGSLQLPNRLIQGPLAGFSCAPFREQFGQFKFPAYCVSEMISAQDVLHKHSSRSRYLYRSSAENILCYQIAGHDPEVMAQAAKRLEELGADLIDINCGCPKIKIRKKGSGSALLEEPKKLLTIIHAVRQAIHIPLTVKIRLQDTERTLYLAKTIEQEGVDALIVHGRHWNESYDKPCNFSEIEKIKQAVSIPVIANGDIQHAASLNLALAQTGCDAYMISRAGTGQPWLYRALLDNKPITLDQKDLNSIFMMHLSALAQLESEHKAVLQSKSLVRYYFKHQLDSTQLQFFYELQSLKAIATFIEKKLQCKS